MSLYANPVLLRSVVDIIINGLENFIHSIFVSLESDILKILENENISAHSKVQIQNCFKLHCSTFNFVNTEAKRLTLLKKRA